MSEVDHSVYAKGTTPAFAPVEMTVEDEARGIARRVNESKGGEREYNIGILANEIRILERNIANGYSGWGFRLSVLRRALELLGVAA